MVVAGETAAETYIHVLDQILLQGMLAVLDLDARSPKYLGRWKACNMSLVVIGVVRRRWNASEGENAAVDVTMCSVGETVLWTLFPCCCRRWRFLV